MCRSVLLAPSLLLLLACGGAGDRLIPHPPSLTLTSPNGGEVWVVGTTATVTWDPGTHAGSVDIDLSTDGGVTWRHVAQGAANDGSEDVPVLDEPTSQARIRVSASDRNPAVAGAPADESAANFRIESPPIHSISGLIGVQYGSLAWGDYDADGWLDLAVAGQDVTGRRVCRIYRNEEGALVDIEADLTGVVFCSLAWGDMEGDGDLDLVVAGLDPNGVPTSRIYRNDAGLFFDADAGLGGVSSCAVAWGDYDGDGDLDLALSGFLTTAFPVPFTRIYTNEDSTFRELEGGDESNLRWTNIDYLRSVGRCSLAWADYDRDGYLDLAVAGESETGNRYTRVYRNWTASGGYETGECCSPDPMDPEKGEHMTFGSGHGIDRDLTDVVSCSLAWADYDNDGYLDLAVSGQNNDRDKITRLYRNVPEGKKPVDGRSLSPHDPRRFTDIGAPLTGVTNGSLAWGDYDGDGDPDLVLAGLDRSDRPVTRLYRNDSATGGGFVPVDAGLTGVGDCSLAWGDYDNDGFLDLALAGRDATGTPVTLIYRNQGGQSFESVSDLTGGRR